MLVSIARREGGGTVHGQKLISIASLSVLCVSLNIMVFIFLHQGPSPSDNILEAAAEKMANAFVQGELCITDWSPDKGAQIKVIIGLAAVVSLPERHHLFLAHAWSGS